MNEGLNDFLTRMGIEETASESNEAVTAVAEPVDTEPEVIDVVDIPPDTPEHQSLSEEDLDDILSELGFEDSSEESESEEDEEEEDNTSRPLYVGEGLMAQVDVPRIPVQPMRFAVTDAGVVAEDGTVVLPMERMESWVGYNDVSLNAEEDEDFNALVNAGRIDPIRATAEDPVHFHMPDGVYTIPVIHEGNVPDADTADAIATMEARDEVFRRGRPHRTESTTEESSVEEPAIPENSPTLLIDDSTSRFSGAEWYQAIQNTKILLAGAGGIGRI